MRKFKRNKIQNFILLSVFFHFLIFLTISGFAKLNQNDQEIEVFILRDSDHSYKKLFKTSTKSVKKQSPSSIKTDAPVVVETQNLEPVMISSTSYFEASQKSTLDEGISDSKSEKDKIIDAEFGTASGPRFIHREVPVYPQVARRLGKEGKVVLRLTIDEKGELVNIEVLEGASYGFTEAAIEAVKKSKFAPAIKNGKPVASRAILPVRFILKN
ncbi:MAG: TonB family protein [Thermodesulfovibrio sp.]|nr:TonB family protein [Thermodesulfovibrio sp.]MDW7972491.1 TonB family protein [Thermodesulfovibrio sp.]